MPNLGVWVEASLRKRVAAELAGSAHVVRRFDAKAPPDRGVLVVRHAAQADELAKQLIALAVLAVIDVGELAHPTSAIADFVLDDWFPGELAARIDRVITQGAPGLRVHLLARAVDFAGDVIELGTSGGVLQYVNPAYTRVLGVAVADAEGKTRAELELRSVHPPDFFQEIDRTLEAGNVWSGRIISRNTAGQLVQLEATIAPVMDTAGQVSHHVAVKRDVTDRVHREQALEEAHRALREARDAALQADRAKSEFLANMSQELRAPLHAIIGCSEHLMEDAAPESELRADLRKIRSSGAHLLALINDVLDISTIEAGKMELCVDEFDLRELLRSIQEAILPLAQQQGNRLDLGIDAAPERVTSDQKKLQQILTNLLSNACRFTSNGSIQLRVDTREQGWLKICVRDTGIGMSVEQQTEIFRPFVPRGSSSTRRPGGTGLGLAISRRFSELMGGRIDVESSPDQGSSFNLWLPEQRLLPLAYEATSVRVIDDAELRQRVKSRSAN